METVSLLAHLDDAQPHDVPQTPPEALHLQLFVLQEDLLLQEQQVAFELIFPDSPEEFVTSDKPLFFLYESALLKLPNSCYYNQKCQTI